MAGIGGSERTLIFPGEETVCQWSRVYDRGRTIETVESEGDENGRFDCLPTVIALSDRTDVHWRREKGDMVLLFKET